MISLVVNGRSLEIDSEESVLDYLNRIGANPRAVAVELNGEIIDRERYATAQLQNGAVVEIVRMVGGGSGIQLRSRTAINLPTPPPGSPPQPRSGRPRAPGRRR